MAIRLTCYDITAHCQSLCRDGGDEVRLIVRGLIVHGAETFVFLFTI